MGKKERDMKAIEELRQKDKEASLKGDFATLRTLIDDDGVLIPPGGPVQSGKEKIDNEFENMKHSYRDVEVTEYNQVFEELEIIGDYAFEWGITTGSSRIKSSNEEYKSSFHLMRILKKQKDGSWKVYRSIWNSNNT